ncbi:MAG: NAD(P)-dependent oxidoreductase [Solirubrobacterales bacterium]|nr:NAD(P)-dependent oxidoreductase [Solirubrobacterales bacterium]
MSDSLRIGWIGAGRMGSALAARLLAAGHDVAVYNRTRSKAEPLAELGAELVDSPRELADRDIVFTMVMGPADVHEVVAGERGILSGAARPRVIVDHTTASPDGGAEVRAIAAAAGVDMLAAPVSGNPRVAETGGLTICVSGPEAAWELARPYLELLGASATYVGEGERARLVKICHNVMLGVVSQCLAEIAVLAEKGGVRRADLMAFLNDSVMGSTFTRYKTPAYVDLDFSVTFTPRLLLKDLDLGLDNARATDVPMPLLAATRELVQQLVGLGYDDVDFAALVEMQARASGYEIASEDAGVGDGLGEPLEAAR